MEITITGISAVGRDLQRALEIKVQEVSADVLNAAKQNTPVKSGNARKHWTAKTTKNGFVVENKVPYIGRLEAGASRQAPRGIIGPTLTQVKGKYK